MIATIVCVFVGGFFLYRKNKGEDKVLRVLLAAIGMSAGMIVALLITGISFAVLPKTTVHFEFEKTELVALSSSSDLQGSFFLASGSVGSEQYYKFYYKTADGGKKFGKIQAESATVYEEDRKDAYMAKAGEESQHSNWAYVWLIPKFMGKDTHWKYTIHVPKGTIKTEYSLDLK